MVCANPEEQNNDITLCRYAPPHPKAVWPLSANILDPVRASVVCSGPSQIIQVHISVFSASRFTTQSLKHMHTDPSLCYQHGCFSSFKWFRSSMLYCSAAKFLQMQVELCSECVIVLYVCRSCNGSWTCCPFVASRINFRFHLKMSVMGKHLSAY